MNEAAFKKSVDALKRNHETLLDRRNRVAPEGNGESRHHRP